MRIIDHKADEQLPEALFGRASQRADHAEVDERDGGVVPRQAGLHKDVAGVRVGVEEADLKELIKVRFDRAFGDFESADTGRFERGVVVHLDAVDPLQHKHAP